MNAPLSQSSSGVRVIACPRPFSIYRMDFQTSAGETVAELLGRCGLQHDRLHARVFIDDRLIPGAEWQQVRPVPGQTLTVRVIPTGGGGGGKDSLRIVAMIAIVALAVYTGGAAAGALGMTEMVGGHLVLTAGGSLFAAAVTTIASIVGSFSANGLMPPRPRPEHRALTQVACD